MNENELKKEKNREINKKIFKWFGIIIVIGFVVLYFIGKSMNQDELEKQEIYKKRNEEALKRKIEYKNSDRYKDSVLKWEEYVNSDRYKDSVLEADKVKLQADKLNNYEKYVSVSKMSWSMGGFGTVALIDKISFKNESLVDVKNINVKFDFKAETGEILKSITKEFKIIVKAGEVRTLTKENMGFIDKQAESVSYKIQRVEKN